VFPAFGRLGFVKASGDACSSQGGSLGGGGRDKEGGEAQPRTLDEVMAKQKQVLEQLKAPGISTEEKVRLKKVFSELGTRSKLLLKQQEAQALAISTAEAGWHGGAAQGGAAAGRGGGAAGRGGRGGGRGGGGAPQLLRFDKRPKTLLVSQVHEDVRFQGLLLAHFQTFGMISSVEQLPDDASMWLVAFEQRFDAENALATPSAKQLNGKQLTLDWYQPAATQQQQQQQQQKQVEGEGEKENEEEEGASEVTDQ